MLTVLYFLNTHIYSPDIVLREYIRVSAMTLCVAFSVFTFDFVCLALQPVGKHSRKSKNVHSGNLGGHNCAGLCSV